MYRYYESNIIFGCTEYNRIMVLDKKWLSKKFPSIEIFSIDIVKDHLTEACYGIKCDVDENTGIVSICDRDKEDVINFFNHFIKYKNFDEKIKLGFYTVISGNYLDYEQVVYTLDK